MSKFKGLAVTGLFSNYNLIFQNVFSFFTIPFSAITSVVGNFVALESKEDARKMFWKMNFATFWLAVVCSVCLLNLSSPFIELFFGDKFRLHDSVAVLMTINFYLNAMRQPVNAYKNSRGLFWQDRFKPIIESAINLLVGLVLIDYAGMLSVLLGTTVSAIAAGVFIEVYIIYKYGFEVSSAEYYRRYVKDTAVACLICIVTWMICNYLFVNTIITLAIKAVICLVISNLILFCFYGRTAEFIYYKGFLKEIVEKIKENWKRKKSI